MEGEDSEPTTYKEAATTNDSSQNTDEFDSLDQFSVEEQNTSEDESDSNSEPEPSDPVATRELNTRNSKDNSLQQPQPITELQKTFIIKQLTTVRKYNQAKPFRFPVDPVRLKIPDYPDIIRKPMDLHTMAQKLKKDMYSSLPTLVADFDQIVYNCAIYNGEDNEITVAARNMREIFDRSMIDLPPPDPAPVRTKSSSPRTRAMEAEKKMSRFSNWTAGRSHTRAARAMRLLNRSKQLS